MERRSLLVFRIIIAVYVLHLKRKPNISAIHIQGKSKGHPLTGHENPEGDYTYRSTLSLTSALDGVVVNATPRLLYPRNRDPVPILQGLAGSQRRSGRVRKIAPTGIRSPDRPVCGESLYQLLYSGLYHLQGRYFIWQLLFRPSCCYFATGLLLSGLH
jgi:hypothetical protein